MKVEDRSELAQLISAAVFALGPTEGELDDVATSLEALAQLAAQHGLRVFVGKVAPILRSVQSLRAAPTVGDELERIGDAICALEADLPELDGGDRNTPLQLAENATMAHVLEFVQEQRLSVEDLERDVVAFEQGGREALDALKRRLHTLKGEAAVLGLEELATVCHAIEDHLARPAPLWERIPRLEAALAWIKDALESYSDGFRPRQSVKRLIVVLKQTIAPPAVEAEEELDAESVRRSLGERAELERRLSQAERLLRATDQTLVREASEEARGGFGAVATALDNAELLNLALLARTAEMLPRRGEAATALRLLFDASAELHRGLTVARRALERGTAIVFTSHMVALIERLVTGKGLSVPPVDSLPPVTETITVDRLGDILVNEGALDPLQLRLGLEAQRASQAPLGDVLIDEGLAGARDVWRAMRLQKRQQDSVAPGAPNAAAATEPKAESDRGRRKVKIDVERVDELATAVGELVVLEAMLAHSLAQLKLPPSQRTALGQLSKLCRQLQTQALGLRVTPIAPLFRKAERLAREIATRMGKRVNVVRLGEEAELDRSISERLADPMVHLIRNALDHGLESPVDRAKAGKDEMGTLALAARQQGDQVTVSISDDGRGIDPDRVVKRAFERKLISTAPASLDEVYALLFAPGFSTREEVTEMSGRGVGMDVVKREVEALAGRIQVTSELGKGTRFELVLPLTLAIVDGLVVRCGVDRYVLPAQVVRRIGQAENALIHRALGRRPLLLQDGRHLPLLDLGAMLGSSTESERPVLVVVETRSGDVALRVDEVLRQQSIVTKRLPGALATDAFSGATILADGRVSLILDVDAIARIGAGRAAEPTAVATA